MEQGKSTSVARCVNCGDAFTPQRAGHTRCLKCWSWRRLARSVREFVNLARRAA